MNKSKRQKEAKKLQEVLSNFEKPAEYRHLIRLLEVDVEGEIKVKYALTKVRGIGLSLSNAILHAAGIDPDKLAGFLTDEELAKIQEVLNNPESFGIPWWMLNRQRDPESGKNLHYTGSTLLLRTKRDIELMMKIKTWKGIRHQLGLKVRGQRTKTTGRKGMAVGVRKKK